MKLIIYIVPVILVARSVLASTGNHLVNSGISAGVELAQAIADKNFENTMGKLLTKVSPYLGMVGPIVGLLSGLTGLGAETAELRYMRRMLSTIENRFDRIDVRLDEIARQIDWSRTRTQLYPYERRILSLKIELQRFFNSKTNVEFSFYNESFVRAYENGIQHSTRMLYNHIVSSNFVFSDNILEAAIEGTNNDRRAVQEFMLGLTRLILLGSQIEMAYYKLKLPDSLRSLKQEWVNKIQNMRRAMKRADAEIVSKFRTVSANDAKNIIRNNKGSANWVVADLIHDHLSDKFYWRTWLVVVYDDVRGNDDHQISYWQKKKADKKGKGKEKTALKTEKKAERKAKKELAKKGEDDIETLIAQFHAKDQEKTKYVEEKCDPPSERSNMTLTPHPDKEELIMFGGEFLTGSKMYMYNDLFFYNIKKNEWTKVTAPNAPPPRSSHQAVALRQHGGQLWIFGGEFASPTQSQFYHYKELWVYHIKNKYWERINSPGGPSSRSGHRMVQCKKLLIVFGGFHDNTRDYKYFNDIYAFNVENYTWSKLDVSGTPPAPRSGCILAAMPDSYRVTVYGGYSKEKVKRDVDKGTTHVDMTTLMPEGKVKDDTIPVKWKWVNAKQSGARPSPRCGLSCAVAPGNRAFCFGGVFDEEEDEEQLEGKFFNELYLLDMEKNRWYLVNLRGKRESTEKKKRRRKKEDGEENEDGIEEEMEDEDEDEEDGGGDEAMEVTTEKVGNMNIEGAEDTEMPEGATNTLFDDGVFQVKIGPALGSISGEGTGEGGQAVQVFQPHARMGALMAVKNGVLFMYGGMFERGDKQFTFKDFYSLDLNKMEEWNVLIENDESKLVWDDSGSSDEEMEACGGEDEEEESSDDDDDIDDILEGCEVPDKNDEETMEEYFERTKDFWIEQSKKYFENEEMRVTTRTVTKFAKEMCAEYVKR